MDCAWCLVTCLELFIPFFNSTVSFVLVHTNMTYILRSYFSDQVSTFIHEVKVGTFPTNSKTQTGTEYLSVQQHKSKVGTATKHVRSLQLAQQKIVTQDTLVGIPAGWGPVEK